MTPAISTSRPLLARVAWSVAALRGWRRAAAAFLAGSLSVLSFAPVHAFPVLFVTLPVFVWLLDGADTPRSAALAGWWMGFGFFFFNLFWIGEAFLVEAEKFAILLPFAVTLLPAGMALFWAAAAYVCKRYWPDGAIRLLLFVAVLSFFEWLRGHVLTGLPWNVLGYALTYPLELMQGAALLGVYGLTPIAILVFAAPLVLLAGRDETSATRRAPLLAVLSLLPLAALYSYGAWRLSTAAVPDVTGVQLRIVQPSIPQREKWMREKQAEIFQTHLALTATNSAGVRDNLAGITHVVWPEAAMPFLPLEHPEALSAIADLLPPGAVLISGALRREVGEDGRQIGFNSILAFDDDGQLVATYDKTHLVPFGEYLPFEPVLSALGLSKLTQGLGSFDSGKEPRPTMKIAGLPPVGGLICYEVLFPGAVIDDANRPGVIINVTNDGWFGDTSGPRQHFHQARVRAVEESVPILRAANNGISAVIDALGRVRGIQPMNARGIIDAALPSAIEPVTPGWWRAVSVFFAIVVCLLVVTLDGRKILRFKP